MIRVFHRGVKNPRAADRKGWTKIVLRRQKCSAALMNEALKWCDEQEPGEGGMYSFYAREYGVYVVFYFQQPNDAFNFKLRWG